MGFLRHELFCFCLVQVSATRFWFLSPGSPRQDFSSNIGSLDGSSREWALATLGEGFRKLSSDALTRLIVWLHHFL